MFSWPIKCRVSNLWLHCSSSPLPSIHSSYLFIQISIMIFLLNLNICKLYCTVAQHPLLLSLQKICSTVLFTLCESTTSLPICSSNHSTNLIWLPLQHFAEIALAMVSKTSYLQNHWNLHFYQFSQRERPVGYPFVLKSFSFVSIYYNILLYMIDCSRKDSINLINICRMA